MSQEEQGAMARPSLVPHDAATERYEALSKNVPRLTVAEVLAKNDGDGWIDKKSTDDDIRLYVEQCYDAWAHGAKRKECDLLVDAVIATVRKQHIEKSPSMALDTLRACVALVLSQGWGGLHRHTTKKDPEEDALYHHSEACDTIDRGIYHLFLHADECGKRAIDMIQMLVENLVEQQFTSSISPAMVLHFKDDSRMVVETSEHETKAHRSITLDIEVQYLKKHDEYVNKATRRQILQDTGKGVHSTPEMWSDPAILTQLKVSKSLSPIPSLEERKLNMFIKKEEAKKMPPLFFISHSRDRLL